MNLLLDTHIFLWWLSGDKSLSEDALSVIGNVRNIVYVSAASIWEISIKQALGKLEAPKNLQDELVEEGFEALVITMGHADLAGRLPRHHRDPFDRMLVAQAKLEECMLVTADERLKEYDVELLLID